MDSSERILVNILAAALAVFLLLSIIAAIKLIEVLNILKRISEQAEKIADKAEAVTSFFEHTAAPAAFFKFLSNITSFMHARKDDKADNKRKK